MTRRTQRTPVWAAPTTTSLGTQSLPLTLTLTPVEHERDPDPVKQARASPPGIRSLTGCPGTHRVWCSLFSVVAPVRFATLILSMSIIYSNTQRSYRGRLAPSPTGYLHVGHARTFWTAFERAREAGGTLVMRMDDLDPERSRADICRGRLDDLRWLGIRWQEGPDVGGPYAPYAQSERRAIYLEAWRKLLRGGYLFPCRCSRRDLEAALSAPYESFRPARRRIPRRMLWTMSRFIPERAGLSQDRPSQPPERSMQRLSSRAVSTGASAFPTAKRSSSRTGISACSGLWPAEDFGDFVVWRRDGIPSYQLACVADDAAMNITEVVRGEDLLKSTARQILLNRALGFENPAWFHCRLVMDENGRRLAKRHDALSLRAMRLRGITPKEVQAQVVG